MLDPDAESIAIQQEVKARRERYQDLTGNQEAAAHYAGGFADGVKWAKRREEKRGV